MAIPADNHDCCHLRANSWDGDNFITFLGIIFALSTEIFIKYSGCDFCGDGVEGVHTAIGDSNLWPFSGGYIRGTTITELLS